LEFDGGGHRFRHINIKNSELLMINGRYQHSSQLRAVRLIGTAGRCFVGRVGRYAVAAVAAGAFSVLPGSASAALHDRGNGLIYDDALDVTWLQDANAPRTALNSGADGNGIITWSAARAWAAALVYGGFGDWRLPRSMPLNGTQYTFTLASDGSSDYGYNISAPGTAYPGTTASELAHLFYATLGNVANLGPGAEQNGLIHSGPFFNLKGGGYWTESIAGYPGWPAATAWGFVPENGAQIPAPIVGTAWYAWAVRDGDVSPVPEPSALLMLAAGGLLMLGQLRRAAVSRQ